MVKYMPYSRREFRRRFTTWLLHNRGLLAVLTAAMVGLLALVSFLFIALATPSALTWWLLGALQSGLVLAYVHLLHAGFLAHDREAIWHLRGSWGEDNTRGELKRAKRRRIIWGWVDSIALQNGDIDHFVVTRNGGLVVIDSKWRNSAHDVVDMAKAAEKAKRRAEAIARSLYRIEGKARHRSKASALPVTPLVVLWGAAQHSLPEHARVEGVDFIAGRQLLDWLRHREGAAVTRAPGKDLLARLEGYRAGAWSNSAR